MNIKARSSLSPVTAQSGSPSMLPGSDLPDGKMKIGFIISSNHRFPAFLNFSKVCVDIAILGTRKVPYRTATCDNDDNFNK